MEFPAAKDCNHCRQRIDAKARVCQHCRSFQGWLAGPRDPRYVVVAFLIIASPFAFEYAPAFMADPMAAHAQPVVSAAPAPAKPAVAAVKPAPHQRVRAHHPTQVASTVPVPVMVDPPKSQPVVEPLNPFSVEQDMLGPLKAPTKP